MGTLTEDRPIRSWGLWWELYHPAAIGLCCALGYLGFGTFAMAYMVKEGWAIDAIYSSVFDLASVFTAFLFTFYTLLVTTDRGFIGRMKSTRSYGLLKQYAAAALILGATTIAFSVPLMVVEPKPVCARTLSHIVVTIWTGLAVWTILAFIRAARLFVEFIRQHP